jgi:putative iron-only hydrogenase system regulator
VAKEYFFGDIHKNEMGRYEMNENLDKQNNRIAVVSILVTDRSVSEKVNGFLSEYGEWILGRMGIPYKEKGVSVLSVVMDAPVEITNALTGKLGRLSGVSVKALFGKI